MENVYIRDGKFARRTELFIKSMRDDFSTLLSPTIPIT
jgi:hypothetical protein